METKSKGGCAFPSEHMQNCNGAFSDGMTLRDYYAAKAMSGMLANPANEVYEQMHERPSAVMFRAVASISYEIADAMLKEREK